jgi:4-nitrophenyl phosphatase
MIRGILLDLDGTVYRGDEEVPGASEFCLLMAETGVRCLFVTNRSNRTPAEVCRQLQGYGVACELEDVLTTSQATAHHLGSGSAYMIGEEGLRVALEEAGIAITDDDPDAVVVGFDQNLHHSKLQIACRLILKGKPFVATNPDLRLTTPDGVIPGTGAILAAIQAVTGVPPIVVGKPEPLLFNLAVEYLGLQKHEVIAVGDSLDTDVPAGVRADIRTALLLTGNARREDVPAADMQPTWVFDDYGGLRELVEIENSAEGGCAP